MWFSAAAILGVFTVASPELDAVLDVLGQVQQRVDGLDAVLSENGPAIGPMTEASRLIVSTLASGIDTVSALEKLKLTSSIGLVSPVSGLKQHTQVLCDRLLGLKSQIGDQGNTVLVGQQVANVKEAVQSLVSVIGDKVPSEVQGFARQQAQGIVDMLARLETSFCADQ